MAFTPEEVSLAGHLTRTPETAAAIAKRVGLDEAQVTALLERLIPRRLVRLDSPGMSAPGLAPVPTEGREEVPAGPVPGRLVRGQHAAAWTRSSPSLRAIRDRGRGRAHPVAPARRPRRRSGAGLAQARADGGDGAPPRHRRSFQAARALSRDPVRVQEGEGAPGRPQLREAHRSAAGSSDCRRRPRSARTCWTGRRRPSS